MFGIYDNGKIIAKFTAPLSVSSNVPVFGSDALSLKRQVTKRTAQRWEISTGIEPLSYGSNELFALFVRKGNSEPISIVMPQNFGAMEALTATGVGTGTGSASETSVDVLGITGTIPVGTFIKFGNHSKIYMLTQKLVGSGTMHIYPALRSAVNATAFSYQKDIIADFLLDLDVIAGMSFTDGILMDLGTIKLVEVL